MDTHSEQLTDPKQPPKCPKCGFVMCEQFDDKPINEHASYAIPNGTYICYHCETTTTR